MDLNFLKDDSPGIPDTPLTPETTQTPEPAKPPDYDPSIPMDLPPELRERLIREGKIPSPGQVVENIVNLPLTQTPVPTPTSYVTRLPDTVSKDMFIPSRPSIFFSNNTSYAGPAPLYQVYYESGILLNATIKELKIHAERGPFSIWYTVHSQGSPRISWAKITVRDPFQTVLYEDGYNREYSSEEVKEFIVYKDGNATIQISGEFATMDISINTPDGTEEAQDPGTIRSRDIPDNIPPELRERLMREGKI